MTVKLNEQRLQQIFKFFADAGVHMHCPCCFQEQWNIPEEQQEKTFYVAAADDDEKGEAIVYETFVMICCVCGFIRQHSYSAMEESKRMLKEKGGKRIITLTQ